MIFSNAGDASLINLLVDDASLALSTPAVPVMHHYKKLL